MKKTHIDHLRGPAFYEIIRKLSLCLLIILPWLMYFVSYNIHLTNKNILIDLKTLFITSITCSITGIFSFFIPWKKISENWFLTILIFGIICLTLFSRTSGFYLSPFISLFFLATVLSAFYFRGIALLSSILISGAGYIVSSSYNPLTFIQTTNGFFTIFIFILIAIAAYFLDRHITYYQRMAENSHEELLKHKEDIHKAKQTEITIEVIGGLSHQLSQPLTVSLGKMHLLITEHEKNPPTKEELELIFEELIMAKNLLQKFSEVEKLYRKEYIKGTQILQTKDEVDPESEQNSSDESGQDPTHES